MSSLRKLRRQAARQELNDNKRLVNDLIESRRNLGIAQMLDGMIQNGISREDLATEYSRGYQAGVDDVMDKYKTAAQPYLQVYVAATAIALHQLYGFGGKRAGRVIASAMEVVRSGTWIDEDEFIEQCKQEVKLDISTMTW